MTHGSGVATGGSGDAERGDAGPAGRSDGTAKGARDAQHAARSVVKPGGRRGAGGRNGSARTPGSGAPLKVPARAGAAGKAAGGGRERNANTSVGGLSTSESFDRAPRWGGDAGAGASSAGANENAKRQALQGVTLVELGLCGGLEDNLAAQRAAEVAAATPDPAGKAAPSRKLVPLPSFAELEAAAHALLPQILRFVWSMGTVSRVLVRGVHLAPRQTRALRKGLVGSRVRVLDLGGSAMSEGAFDGTCTRIAAGCGATNRAA